MLLKITPHTHTAGLCIAQKQSTIYTKMLSSVFVWCVACRTCCNTENIKKRSNSHSHWTLCTFSFWKISSFFRFSFLFLAYDAVFRIFCLKFPLSFALGMAFFVFFHKKKFKQPNRICFCNAASWCFILTREFFFHSNFPSRFFSLLFNAISYVRFFSEKKKRIIQFV